MVAACSHSLRMLRRSGLHRKCRNGLYPFSQVRRFPVGDEHAEWQAPYSEYAPLFHEAASLKNKPWSDPRLGAAGFRPLWHQLDAGINRQSHEGAYRIVDGAPQNPAGRTGIVGRGVLGRWGPNHAADPVVTRWKREEGEKVIHSQSQRAVLQFCAIQRHDNNEWAIPGGMVDPNEKVSQTLRREFMEEAMDSHGQSQEQLEKNKRMVEAFFEGGIEFYKGYVDDPRNTDQAWMETVAVNFHDDSGEQVGSLQLTAGDDAKAVRWIDVDGGLALYASHKVFVEHVAKMHKAHF